MKPTTSYLQEMTIRLAMGLSQVDPAQRERHANFLKAQQKEDGGFGGREGPSDLYYTSFALRSLAVLGELYGEMASRARTFLHRHLESQEKLIDHLSLVFGAALLEVAAGEDVYGDGGDRWKDRFAERLDALRREDGGYAKGSAGRASSTYFTFLILLCRELLGRPEPDRAGAIRFLHSQRDEQGGFREIRVGKRAGVNPTAAAIGALRLLDALDDPTRTATSRFLAEMQDETGGFLANSRIPITDLLSTFTGVTTSPISIILKRSIALRPGGSPARSSGPKAASSPRRGMK